MIIISTVRSNPDYLSHDSKYNLGFLGDPKRFNVAVTRAQKILCLRGNLLADITNIFLKKLTKNKEDQNE